ncbi:MAG: phosphate signaling complex protein PhoU [Akkermansia sp.]|nr:phosphate signaling complex protein PhoU [Akkermansia sp.]
MQNHFIKELSNLRCQLCQQGANVQKAIEQAIQSFSTGDSERAQQVIEQDKAIDLEEIRIEEECLKTLALYQPVAGDLRTVISYIKINTSLERMADFACHIAERAINITHHSRQSGQELFDFSPMASHVQDMLHNTLNIVDTGDFIMAHKVIEQDDAVDAMRNDHRSHAKAAIISNPIAAEYYLDCIGLARDLERIADLAADICQHIIYLRTGFITRHKG